MYIYIYIERYTRVVLSVLSVPDILKLQHHLVEASNSISKAVDETSLETLDCQSVQRDVAFSVIGG
jgi:hypothetical protein